MGGVIVQRLLRGVFEWSVGVVWNGLICDRAEDSGWESDPCHVSQVAPEKQRCDCDWTHRLHSTPALNQHR